VRAWGIEDKEGAIEANPASEAKKEAATNNSKGQGRKARVRK
jgi:hypothetical protein